MRLTIRPGVLELFPEALVGLAVATNLDNSGEDPKDAADLRRAEAGLPVHHFPLADAAKAHAAVERGITGKVLIDVADL